LNLLAVDATSGEWRKVADWAALRITEHAATCTNPTLSEAERLAAAVRCDELRQLLAAPAEARRLTEQRVPGGIATY